MNALIPPVGRFLLDTNIIIALFESEESVLFNLRQAPEVFVPAIALGEMFFGAANSGRPAENRSKVEKFAEGREVLSCDFEVAREYGLIRKRLKDKGRPLPENDIWIAAIAIRHALTLVTRDRHFDEVEGLNTTDWEVSN